MTIATGDLIAELARLGVHLWVESGRLRFRAPHGVMTEERRAALRSCRDEVIAQLTADQELPELVAAPGDRHEPFPVTEVQAAYLLGRGGSFAYGQVACHGYGELNYPDLDPERMAAAWQALIDRHDMLRAVVDRDGAQRVLPEVQPYRLAVADLRGRPEAEVTAALRETRSEMDHRVFAPDRWPLFEARVTRADSHAVLHMSIDFLIADFVSIQILLDELHRLYHRPEEPLPPLEITFRDYLLSERSSQSAGRHDRDRRYWWERLDELPAAPDLPVRPDAKDSPPRFRRWQTVLPDAGWSRLRRNAGEHGISPSVAVLAAYAEVIAGWSRQPRFTLDLTLLNRLPLHPQVGSLVGDFTSLELLAVDADPDQPFGERARLLQARLWEDLDHRSYNGIEVMRELSRRHGPDAALFPVVYTSAIGLADGGAATPQVPVGELGYGISQTPQVWVDCQNFERQGALWSNWDVREGVFSDGVVDAMFAAYSELLERLAEPGTWSEDRPVRLPDDQAARRRAFNDTDAPVPDGLLHHAFVEQARRTPDRVAVISADREVTYGETLARATGVARRLRAAGCHDGTLVGVVSDRGWEQVVAVIGVLLAGGAYVPVDTTQPPARRAEILRAAGIRLVLTQSWLPQADAPDGVDLIAVDTLPPAAPQDLPTSVTGSDLAYVIHTSGSTGSPKGVMISHRAALNTVADINQRFGIGPADRVLGLSHLGFDLSVYDIFGPLAVGGCLVVPAPDRPADPSHWMEIVARHRVTIWNSVPAQLQMLTDYLSTSGGVPATLRLALLSGDWIPVTLPDQIRSHVPRLRLVGLGGATEAAIWSIHHLIGEVPAEWRSIPYGRPLTNQRVHVLDSRLRECPDWVTGQIYIGGVGVADGYLNDPARTAERFIRHPGGERLYDTGDLGRYLPDGEIEFLGREDNQVKIRGYRIELAEIESALCRHPAVAAAAVVADGDRPMERRLVAFLETARHADTPASGSDQAVAEDLASAAAGAGDAVLTGVDRDRYLSYSRRLDLVALPSMAHALRSAGLFATPGDVHTYREILATAKVSTRHHKLVRRWLRALTREGLLVADGGGYRMPEPVGDTAVADAWAAVDEVAPREDDELLGYFRASIGALPALLRGDTDPLTLLFPGARLDVSRQLYEDALFNRWVNRAAGAAVRRIADQRLATGPLRVLEVGGGAGGTTAAVLDALNGIDVDYLCTDLSPFFLNQTQERFAGRDDVRHAVYDLDRDPRTQALSPQSFDVVVAGDVLHATADTGQTLSWLRGLLAPGGWLIAAEMTRDHYQIMTSLELLAPVEQNGDETPAEQPYGGDRDRVFLDRESWLTTLQRAGADLATCVPGDGAFISELGMTLFAARFKSDRVRVDHGDLTAHLAERLPGYMIPASITMMDALPLNANGKIDRRVLRDWLPSGDGTVQAAVSGASEPETELERRIAAIWSEALRAPEVGRDVNLFALGGDSLVAAQIAGRVVEEVPEAGKLFFDQILQRLLEAPTVAELADQLTAAGDTAGEQATDTEKAAAPDRGLLVHLGGPDEGVPHIIVHDSGGSLSRFTDLVTALDGNQPVFGISGTRLEPGVADATDPGSVVDLGGLAAGYAGIVKDAGHRQVRMIGYGLTAPLAVEVARTLAEGGVEVLGLTLLGGCWPTATSGAVDDDALRRWYAEELGNDRGDGPEYQRFRSVVAAAVRHEPTLYAGDIVVVRPASGPGATETATEVWADICLGDLQVVEAGVGHRDLLTAPSPAVLR